jgi:hypothetical protein
LSRAGGNPPAGYALRRTLSGMIRADHLKTTTPDHCKNSQQLSCTASS